MHRLLSICLVLCGTLWSQPLPDIPTTAPIVLQPAGLTVATLGKDWDFLGHHLGAGTYLHFKPDGSLRGFVPVRDTSFSGVPLPALSVVRLSAHGSLDWCFLPRDTEVQGHLVKGNRDNWMTTFHSNGRLKLVWLARDEVIDGVPCRQTHFLQEFLRLEGWGGTSFHEDGRLASCALAADAVVQGRSLRKNTRVRFDPEGKLQSP